MKSICAFIICIGFAGVESFGDTTFTYQGELKENGAPANGSFNMDFSLWDAENGGTQIGSTVLLNGVQVTDGRFSVELDFGNGAFNSPAWLEIVVVGVMLSPRNAITAAPIATQLQGTYIDSSTGRLGINTNLPLGRLHVETQVSSESAIHATSLGASSIAVQGNGQSYGLYGEGGITGVYGAATIEDASGVFGRATGENSRAIYGFSIDGWGGYFVGDGYFSGALRVGTSIPVTHSDYFTVRTPAPDNVYGGMYIDTDGTTALPFYGYATNGTAQMWTYYSGITGDWHVWNGGDERLSVEPNGQVGINETNPAYNLEVNGSAGKPGGGSWSNSSDIRLKKDVDPLNNVLDHVLQLRGVTFEYRDPLAINELQGRQIGVIAQDVEKVFPNWVEERDDGYKSVTFRGFEALTVEAIRELRNEKDSAIESLRIEKDRQIAELNDRITQLEDVVRQFTANHKER